MCACLWSWTERALGQSSGTRRELGAVGLPCTDVKGGIIMHGCRGCGRGGTGDGMV